MAKFNQKKYLNGQQKKFSDPADADRTEVPTVTCRMCRTGACEECYTSEGRSSRWLHICKTCLEEVDTLRGEAALSNSQINNTIRKTTKEKTKEPEIIAVEKETGDEEEKEEEVFPKVCSICDQLNKDSTTK